MELGRIIPVKYGTYKTKGGKYRVLEEQIHLARKMKTQGRKKTTEDIMGEVSETKKDKFKDRILIIRQ